MKKYWLKSESYFKKAIRSFLLQQITLYTEGILITIFNATWHMDNF